MLLSIILTLRLAIVCHSKPLSSDLEPTTRQPANQPPTPPPPLPVTIDLTYPFDSNTIYWPGGKTFHHEIVYRGKTANFYYEANNFAGAEHGGTHLDAPSHFCDPQNETESRTVCWRSHEIPASRLHGEGVIIDISNKTALTSLSNLTSPDLTSADVQLTVSDLEKWEEDSGRQIPKGAILLVYSGWGRHYGDAARYLGNDRGDTKDMHFPGVAPEAASWIVSHRPWVSMVGIDTPSLDFGPSTDFQSHRILLGANIPGLENVAHLDKLVDRVKGGRVEVFALPMLIRGGSGGPARIIAVVRRSEGMATRGASSSTSRAFQGHGIVIALILLGGAFAHIGL